jgi:hypothetical protein
MTPFTLGLLIGIGGTLLAGAAGICWGLYITRHFARGMGVNTNAPPRRYCRATRTTAAPSIRHVTSHPPNTHQASGLVPSGSPPPSLAKASQSAS